MSRGCRARPGLRLPVCVVVLGALSSCQRSNTPEAACQRLVTAVRERDAGAVFDALLQTTQWSIYTVAKLQHEMAGLIAKSYPPAERAQALGRLTREASDTTGGRSLFRVLYPQRYAADFQHRLGTGALRVALTPDGATCMRATGQPYRLARSPAGGWGMSELDSEWELAKIRAVHDAETVRENARLYKQAQVKP